MTGSATMISPSERMIAEKDGAIGWMIFNNPARRNAISLDMWQAMPVILDAFERDPEIRVIVLKGAGDKAFISGADISQFEQQRSSAETIAQYDKVAEAAGGKLQETRKPTIAMIHGFCIGGGLGVALQCDLRIAADNARFAIPAARLGLGYRWGGVKKLVDIVGAAYAKEIFFTARQFTAVEALGMGLVNRVLPEGELEAYVHQYCAQMAENAPLTLEAVKGVVQELQKPAAGFDRTHCEELVARCFESQDYIEGRRAFMEKRKPVFAGK
jgi:enoyl-CoA hydratase